MIQVEGALNEADMLPIARYAVWHRSWVMKYILGCGVLILLMNVASVALGERANVGVLVGIVFAAYPFVAAKLTVRKALKANAFVSEMGVYEFEESKFSIARPSLQVAMPWSNIHSVVELADQFAIFVNQTCFYAVPKRFFRPEQIDPFRVLVQRALAEKGKKFEVIGR